MCTEPQRQEQVGTMAFTSLRRPVWMSTAKLVTRNGASRTGVVPRDGLDPQHELAEGGAHEPTIPRARAGSRSGPRDDSNPSLDARRTKDDRTHRSRVRV